MKIKEKVVKELNKDNGFHPVLDLRNREVKALIIVLEEILNDRDNNSCKE